MATITGTAGDDTISGTTANDTIIGLGGNDTLTGGGGSDIFVFNARQFGQDTITDFSTVDDKLDLSAIGPYGLDVLQPFIKQVGADTVLSFGYNGNAETITLKNVTASLLTAANFVTPVSTNVTITGSANADTLFGSYSSVDTINSGDGNDTISVGNGASTIDAGTGDDLIYLYGTNFGGTINGGAGNDTLVLKTQYEQFGSFYGTRQSLTSIETIKFGASISANFPVQFRQSFISAGFSDFANVKNIIGDGYIDQISLSISTPGTYTIPDIALSNWKYNVVNPNASASIGLQVTGQTTASFTLRAREGLRSVQILNGGQGSDTLIGSSGVDVLYSGGGNDLMIGGADNDILYGTNTGIETAVIAANRADATVVLEQQSTIVVYSQDGVDRLNQIDLVQFNDGLYSFHYASSGAAIVANFNPANGWTSQDKTPRHVADINGDGYADIVGFGTAGVLASYGFADGTYSAVKPLLADFGQAQGWTSDNAFHRELADVNGDGRADIVGFGTAGVLVALATSNGFTPAALGTSNFNAANGWSSEDAFTRTLADVNGDGFADIVGFGSAGTLVSLGNGDGTFKAPMLGLANFGTQQGWTSDNLYHRELADVNGDGKADIVGFGSAGAYVALSNGDGTFQSANLALANFGVAQGWSSEDAFTRHLGDVNGDGFADIVGFGVKGTYVAYGQSNGTFSAAAFDIADFGANQGWTSDQLYHRELADLNRDGQIDIVGFGVSGALASHTFLATNT